jgi:4-hydroxybenzoate polyprenyltransferase
MAEPTHPAHRQLGYRLLGRGFDYLLHLRPAEWPIVAGHAALGAIVAVGWDGLTDGPTLRMAAIGLLAWVIGLNGGTLAINSAFDRDEGDVAYLRRPPPPPPGLFAFGMALMVFGLGLTWHFPPLYRNAYLICVVLSVLYSVPPFRLKAVAGMDWLINMLGFGLLTPLAGWAATGAPLTPEGRLLLLGFLPLFAALYPLTQLYQVEEDRRRGDRTLAILLGPRWSLRVAILGVIVAFACFTLASRAVWPPGLAGIWRWSGMGVSLAVWMAVLLPWLARAGTMAPRQHQRGMHRALGAWAVTDLAIILAWG